MAINTEEMRQMLERDEDEIFALLGQADASYEHALFSSTEAIARGRQAFARLSQALYQKICVEWNYCGRQHDSEFTDNLSLGTAIANLIVTVVGGLPAVTVAALLVKKGLGKFCECNKQS